MKYKIFFSTVAIFYILLLRESEAQQVVSKTDDSETVIRSVSPLIFGIQLGTGGVAFGSWLYSELKLSNRIVLRGEVGLDFGYRGGDRLGGYFYMITFAISARVEPRWYYFLVPNGQKNDGSFLGASLWFSHHPSWLIIANYTVSDVSNLPNRLYLIPKWGIKKTFGNHLTLEGGFGIGYGILMYDKIRGDIGVDVHLRVGFTF